jgi:hypothetical protein
MPHQVTYFTIGQKRHSYGGLKPRAPPFYRAIVHLANMPLPLRGELS